jgi:hypothetical protein
VLVIVESVSLVRTHVCEIPRAEASGSF